MPMCDWGTTRAPELEELNVTALVDTGALHLCVPEHVALQLRLSQKQPREVQTADGRSHLVPYVSPVKVSLLGRECVTGALVFGNQVLLGAIPMEDMDLIIERARQQSPSTRRARTSPCRWPRVPDSVVRWVTTRITGAPEPCVLASNR